MKRIVLVTLIALCSWYIIKTPRASSPWDKKAQAETPDKMALAASAPNTLTNWPPRVGAPFPAIKLYTHEGSLFSLDTLKGKPTLIEFVAMTCAGCQGFSGGNIYGGFKGFAVQKGLPSIESITKRYGGIALYSPDINYVQIIIYNLALDPPSKEDLTAWREHFHFDRHANTTILGGDSALANKDSFAMIPGFMLLDSTHTVCFDASGHTPRHNLYTTLVPAIAPLKVARRCSTGEVH